MGDEGVVVGVDVGTASVRAGVVSVSDGRVISTGVREIATSSPAEGVFQQRSGEVWAAVCGAVREAVRESGAHDRVRALAFDATCSLVVVGEGADVSPPGCCGDGGGGEPHDVILWMCHRAAAEADEINATGHEALRYVGGRVSPEMEPPKLLWLKRRRPDTFAAADHFFDLADYLTWRATGSERRSVCTVTCKWGYVGDAAAWASFWAAAGLGELAGSPRIGTSFTEMGTATGSVTAAAAAELGVPEGVAVAAGAIDAHAGAVGVLGSAAAATAPLERRAALVAGTSACHMAVCAEERFLPGVWGPYRGAALPGAWWVLEGGQSAAGALLDHVLRSAGASPSPEAYAALNARLARMAEARGTEVWRLAAATHVLPYFHGCRCPRADASLTGSVCGLRLAAGDEGRADALALQYLASVQALALGTRHILGAMLAPGARPFEALALCGGLASNSLYVRAHADATGCRVTLPREREAVLLGAAVLACAAAPGGPPVEDAMRCMSHARETVEPRPEAADYYERKFRVYLAMHEDAERYRAMMQQGQQHM